MTKNPRSVRYWTDQRWLIHFQQQADRPNIPIAADDRLTDDERAAIAHSIAIFQLGESSEGKHFIGLADRYASATDNPAYAAALRLFIREEQRHAEQLRRIMVHHGVPTLRSQWTDSLFRRLRHVFNLEMEVVVLVTAEFVARIYYPALAAATGSVALKTLCREIIKDEVLHVYFQTHVLADLRRQRSAIGIGAVNACHTVFFALTLLVVWLDHHRVFKAAKVSFPRFWTRAFREHWRCLRLCTRRSPSTTPSPTFLLTTTTNQTRSK